MKNSHNARLVSDSSSVTRSIETLERILETGDRGQRRRGGGHSRCSRPILRRPLTPDRDKFSGQVRNIFEPPLLLFRGHRFMCGPDRTSNDL